LGGRLPAVHGSGAKLGILTRAALQSLAVSLARSPVVVGFARTLADYAPPRDRLARLATLFRFVATLSEAHVHAGPPRDAVDVLLGRLGEHRGPAVLLSALLLALGEHAELECTREMALVRVPLAAAELRRLPPHAAALPCGARVHLFLDPRGCKSPFGFLPAAAREALLARHRAGPALRRLPPACA
jgi:hypothetical protein